MFPFSFLYRVSRTYTEIIIILYLHTKYTAVFTLLYAKGSFNSVSNKELHVLIDKGSYTQENNMNLFPRPYRSPDLPLIEKHMSLEELLNL